MLKRIVKTIFITSTVLGVLAGCQQAKQSTENASEAGPTQASDKLAIDYKKYTLDNGLTVILHQDKSDPLVHVDMTYHVGSSREDIGKSGFAHFFEHMMFQGSEHVADEQHFKIITEAGGNLNGSTNSDRTNYYQTVPANQLEKVLWLESDRMGYLLQAVNQTKFENQRETVKNERAQRVDNQPYGLRNERTAEALYPSGHPYSWQPIGYVEDLDRVNVDDLKAFFKRWYGPNNAVLTIGGDIDIAQTKQWVENYFGGIPAGPEVAKPEPQPVTLEEDRYITLEDNVHLPLLQVTYPTVYARHPDEAPLDVLADILGGGKTSLLYKNLVKNGQAVQTAVNHPCRELACEFQLFALANPASTPDLAKLRNVVVQTLEEFEARGVKPDDLARVKASIESSTVFGLQSVAGKVSKLAAGETFSGKPDLVREDIERYNAVTASDVMRVYRKYIKHGHGVILSVVPQGQAQLAVKEQNFTLPERQIPSSEPAKPVAPLQISESIDRNNVPPAGPAPVVEVPDYWESTLADTIPLLGVTSSETPTVTFTLNMEGGMLLDPEDKAGTAYLTALMMNESTQQYSNESIANELAKLGSSIQFSSRGRYTQVMVSSLTKNIDQTMALLEEKLFHPAFLEQDFERMKARVLQSMQQQLKNPSSLATRARDWILFGKDSRLSLPEEGTLATLQNITLQDIKAYYNNYYTPDHAHAVVVSDLSANAFSQTTTFLKQWESQDYAIPEFGSFPQYTKTHTYLVDKPGAVQSVVHIVKRGPKFDATETYFKSNLMNFPLGGAFNSRINLNLREDKGYTYGASTAFIGGKTLGWFDASADLNGEFTAKGIEEMLNEIRQFASEGVKPEEVTFMRNAYTLSDALKYETPSSKARFLSQLQAYDLPDDYRQQQLDIIKNIDAEQLNALAKEQLIVEDMQIIVVGDKQKILEQLFTLGFPVIELSLEQKTQRELTP
ncbi:M16 family metallopeptidase [Salinimonas chungwhensis]|uniref:M16 family metallopeptidase n=1 Tax=Salinimonas chungwhensis TaxID=265425 RepID=UPI00035F1AAC|nr:pitrilysin family protein [Salinimonas chungwhensis]